MSNETVLSKAFNLFKEKITVTPSELDALMPGKNYASKHVFFLKRHGYTFLVNKTGKRVDSYTILNPDHVSEKSFVPGKRGRKKGTGSKRPPVPFGDTIREQDETSIHLVQDAGTRVRGVDADWDKVENVKDLV